MSCLTAIVDIGRFPVVQEAFQSLCRQALDEKGVLVMPGFLKPEAVDSIRREGEAKQDQAFYCSQNHNVYLTPPDPAYASGHPRNREVTSSKGCITDDQIARDSALRTLYDAEEFRDFLCAVLGIESLYD